MRKLRLSLFILAFVVGSIFCVSFMRVGGWLTQFETTEELETRILEDLTAGTSTKNDVMEFIEANIREPDFCNSPMYPTLEDNYDEVIQCAGLADPAWIGDPITEWYGFSFYFQDEVLVDIGVGSDILAP